MSSPSKFYADRLLLRFFRQIKRSTTDCWLWQGAKSQSGYGKIGLCCNWSKSWMMVHRLSYELFISPIPEGCYVCHHCDVPSCANPDHLFTGTALENMTDAKAKGRMASGARTGTYTHPETRRFGRANPAAKLDQHAIQYIRAKYSRGSRWKPGLSQRSLAIQFRVSQKTIADIVRGKTWTQS